MDNQQIKFIVSNTLPFNKLDQGQIDELFSICQARDFKKDEIVYKEGGVADYFYLLLRGRVVALSRQNNKDVPIDILKRGTCFGIISLFTDEPHSVTAKAIEPSLIARIEKEKFKNFLTKNPTLSLDFSRMLSQRVHRRAKPKKIFQCQRIAICGFSHSGKTTYMLNLASEIAIQAKKTVISIQFLDNAEVVNFSGSKDQILCLNEFEEEKVFSYILKKDTDQLLVDVGGGRNLLSLLNFLSDNYHFVIYEMPFSCWQELSGDLFSGGDELHFIFPTKKEELKKANKFLVGAVDKEKLNNSQIKIILNDFFKEEYLAFTHIQSLLDYPIYATLPPIKNNDYSPAIIRIARDCGKVRLGLVLGSGAAYGLSHIGVLKVLEKNNLTIDIACGTSIGAFIAALWACGYKISEIEKYAKQFGKRIGLFGFSDISFPIKGLFSAKHLEGILQDIFKDITFFDLKHTLKITAFDFIRREEFIIEEGLVYKAVAASCAFPGIFEPVKIKDKLLLDGGVLNPLPSKILLNRGINKIIAVNINPTCEEIYKGYKSMGRLHIFDFIFGSIETMHREFIGDSLNAADIVIHPNLEALGWTEFSKMVEFIKRGEAATEEKLPQILKLVNL